MGKSGDTGKAENPEKRGEIYGSTSAASTDHQRPIGTVWREIDCTGVEDALDVTTAQQTELDYLIYNDPLSYADLILNGDPEKYLKNVAGSHGLED